MELRQLEYFLAVAESGAFSRAAVLLSVGQPVLSRQIKSLEDELGAQLYHRTGRGIILTEAGKVFAEHVRGVLERTARARNEIQELGSSTSGRAVIGMPPSVGAVFTVPLVQRFRKEFPKASLVVMEGFSGHILEWLTAGRLDVAILYNAPSMNNLSLDPLLTEELVLLGPVADPAGVGKGPVAASRLSEIPLILPSRPHGLRMLMDEALSKAGIPSHVEIEINAMPSTLKLVELGTGYTILPVSCVHDLLQAGRIRGWPIVKPKMTRELVLASSTQRPATRAARALGRMVRLEVHALDRLGRWTPER